MKYIIFTVLGLFGSLNLFANNVRIENFSRTGDEITFNLKWDNSWTVFGVHRDGVYIFVKQAPNGGPSWVTANISAGSATNNFSVTVPADQLGTLIRHNYQNVDATTTVTLTLTGMIGAYQDIKVMALEMVYVPTGSFRLGDGASDRSYHRGDDPAKSYPVSGEGAILRGNTSSNFDGGSTNYSGDILADFPKGYDGFHSMKYLLTQQQYVDFLNCLPRIAQDARTRADLSGTTVANNYNFVMSNSESPGLQNGISCDNDIGTGNINFYCNLDNDGIPNENTDGQNKIAGYLTNADIYAYLDWAGLAPMTSMQYEKACRGTLPAVAEEFAWGSTLQNPASAFVNNGTAQEKYANSGIDGGIIGGIHAQRVGLNAPSSNATRELSNASFYGIVGLSGIANNPVIPISALYSGEQGDGELTPSGEADFMDITIPLQSKDYTSLAGRGRVSSYNGLSLSNSPAYFSRSLRGIFYLVL